MWLRLRHIGEYLAVRIALSIIQAVSIETCDVVCRWLAYLAADIIGGLPAQKGVRHQKQMVVQVCKDLRSGNTE